MSILSALISIALQIAGICFLFAAGVGLLRFNDPLQRMHAATKAGTIGAGLILAGAVFTINSFEGVIVGCLAIFFLLLTAPVAGHLLGRAAYISGAPLVGLENIDALRGVVDRHHAPSGPLTHARPLSTDAPSGAGSDGAATTRRIPVMEGVRFVIIAPDETVVAQRALDISRRNDLPVQARALIDRDVLEHATSPEKTREQIKHRLADAIGRVETRFAQAGVRLSMFYSEGNAYKWIPSLDSDSVLLVLPQAGWCHHGVGSTPPAHDAEQLIRLAHTHVGPCLLVRQAQPHQEDAHVLLVDDGTERSVDALMWALEARLWQTTLVTLDQADSDRLAVFRRALTSMGWSGDARLQNDQALTGQPDNAPPDVLVRVASTGPTDGDAAEKVWTDYLNAAAFKEVLMFPRET